MLLRFLVCACMGGARLAELALSRRNIQQHAPAREGHWSRQTYPVMVVLHTAVILGTLVFGRRRFLPALLLLLAVQPIRVWVLATLRDRWNTRAAIDPTQPVETGGPYAYVRHPNYTVVAIELAALPLAFRRPGLALAATAVNAALLALRIPEEEAMLETLPGFTDHFATKPRFLPSLRH
jgi:methyltransferase